MDKKNILIVLGTRPEVIKLAPIIIQLRHNDNYNVVVCNTEQQKELSNQTFGFFGIKADINLGCMKENQTLDGLQNVVMSKLSNIFLEYSFDGTIVQGDTMSAFCGALMSFYNKVPVFHIEAGLRSYNIFEPFPEEALRAMISKITTLHFAPTQKAKEALIRENITKDVYVVGNTSIDALKYVNNNMNVDFLDNNENVVLVTIHRRENHGDRLKEICKAIRDLAKKFIGHKFIVPMHPNPNVKNIIYECFQNLNNVVLSDPLPYPKLIAVFKKAKLILTDSGGIQEEAPSFGIPILVLRYKTERMEGVEAGFSTLVGADYENIIQKASEILQKNKNEIRISRQNPYGDGNTSKKIIEILGEYYGK